MFALKTASVTQTIALNEAKLHTVLRISLNETKRKKKTCSGNKKLIDSGGCLVAVVLVMVFRTVSVPLLL